MNLTKEDIKKIKHTENATLLDLSIGSFFSKVAYVDYASWYSTSELIGSLIGSDLGFITPKIKIVMPNVTNESERWIISENLNNYGTFFLARDLGIDSSKNSSLNDIMHVLKCQFKENATLDNLLNDLIKLYLFDILVCNGDRCCVNWGVIQNAMGLHIAIFDNESLMNDTVVHEISSSLDGSKWLDDVYENTKELRIKKLKEDLTHFLEFPHNPYLDVVREMLLVMTPEYFESILKRITEYETITTEDKEIPYFIDDAELYLNMYRENYDLVKAIYDEVNKTKNL